MNQGAELLERSEMTLAAVVRALEKQGVRVTPEAVRCWRNGSKLPGDVARVALSKAPFRIPPDAWDRRPGAEPKPQMKRHRSDPAKAGVVVDAATLAKEQLERIQAWRREADEDASDATRAKLAALEMRAIRAYAQLTGQATSTEAELARSPQWARLRSDLVSALEKHPEAAKDVLAAIERHAS
jgi:hypothetical protein